MTLIILKKRQAEVRISLITRSLFFITIILKKSKNNKRNMPEQETTQTPHTSAEVVNMINSYSSEILRILSRDQVKSESRATGEDVLSLMSNIAYRNVNKDAPYIEIVIRRRSSSAEDPDPLFDVKYSRQIPEKIKHREKMRRLAELVGPLHRCAQSLEMDVDIDPVGALGSPDSLVFSGYFRDETFPDVLRFLEATNTLMDLSSRK